MEQGTGRGARGEALLNVEGTVYPVLFTNRALAQAEREIGKPMLQFVQGLAQNQLGVTETAQLLAVGLEAGRRDAGVGGRPYALEDAWRLMDALGFTGVVTAVAGAIAEALAFAPGEAGGRPPV